VIFEETTQTLFCGDLFAHSGNPSALTQADIVGPAIAAEDLFKQTSLGPTTAPTIRGLADLKAKALATMRGASYSGDGIGALEALADQSDSRLSRLSRQRLATQYCEEPGLRERFGSTTLRTKPTPAAAALFGNGKPVPQSRLA
jgi:hypothetical protein